MGGSFDGEAASDTDNIVVLGAGAKAVALSAKAAVLRDLGYQVPGILAVEQARVASAWTRAGGMTSGRLILGTPPEKDVGFPYLSARSWPDSSAVDMEMSRRFSWASYLISRGTYAEFIDRGRPQPRHSDWGDYLTWVSGESAMQIMHGAVTSIDLGSQWNIHVTSDNGNTVIGASGLVITGYGALLAQPASDLHDSYSVTDAADRHIDVAGFWRHAAENLIPDGGRVMVVGAGEAAAGIVEHLLRRGKHKVAVTCPGYAIYSRGESFYENEMYSNPDRWQAFPIQARREFIGRTDRGVFSGRALAALAELDRIEIIGGRVVEVRDCGSCAEVTVDHLTEKVQHHVDLVIDASGRDAAWFLRLMSNSVMAQLMEALDGQVSERSLCEAVTQDLSMRGLTPRLHAPNLAGLMQGPGFPGLSCLGLMSDRILGSYVASSQRLQDCR
jgi:mycobactin lysine-N-oxygenase